MSGFDLELRVDFDQLTLDDLVGVEEGDTSARFVRSILSRFMINPATGDYYPEEEGERIAGKLKTPQAKAAVDEFAKQVKEIKTAKIPPTNGGN